MRVVFSLVPAAAFLLAATALLNFLEAHRFINTVRPDDRVASRPVWLVDQCRINGKKYWRTAPTRISGMIDNVFPVEKDPDAFRVVVTGGSFAMGSPWVFQGGKGETGFGSIPDWIRAELTERYPSRRIEVINGGIGGGASPAVRFAVAEFAKVNPDLIVVATGNNEGYVATTFLNPTLHEWVFYRAMKKILLGNPAPEERSWFMPQDPDTVAIARKYEANIRGIVETARARRIPLVLATLPINLKWHGVVGLHGSEPPLPDDADIEAGLREVQLGHYETAIEHFLRSRNPGHAAWFIAVCEEKLGQFDAARESYKIHVQFNPSNRARPSYNEFVRGIARQDGVHLADLEKRLEALSPNGLPAPMWFVDYCHMTWQGYAEMGREIVRVIVADGLVPGAEGEPLPPPTQEAMIVRNGWQTLWKFQ
jgi:hypothetical protein